MSDATSGPGSRLPASSRQIRDAVLHLRNEQPLLCDLVAIPTAADEVVVCTNLRTTTGERPNFIDASDSIFYFPFAEVRFIEIKSGFAGRSIEPEPDAIVTPPPEPEIEIDEGFIRRVRDL